MTDANQIVDLSRLEISEIRSKECVARFNCGERDIDDWARGKAFKYHQQDRARVFCCRKKDNASIVGFYSLSLNQIGAKLLFDRHEDRYANGHAPFVYVDWFAVVRSCQSSGVGRIMMMNALERAFQVSFNIPFYGVALRSLNEKTTKFYEKHGFEKRTNDRHPVMILPIWTIRDLFQFKISN